MAKMTKMTHTVKSATGSYYTYAALYFEGYYCCANMRIPAVYRA